MFRTSTAFSAGPSAPQKTLSALIIKIIDCFFGLVYTL